MGEEEDYPLMNPLRSFEFRLLRCTLLPFVVEDSNPPPPPVSSSNHHHHQLLSLIEDVLTSIESGEYARVLSSNASQSIFKFHHLTDADSTSQFYSEIVVSAATSFIIGDGDDADADDHQRSYRAFLVMMIAVSAFLCFTQVNMIGPLETLPSMPLMSLIDEGGPGCGWVEWEAWARNELMLAGSDLLGKFSNLQYVVFAKILLMKTRDLLPEGSLVTKYGNRSISWWLARLLLLQQKILDENSSSLFDLLQVFMRESLHHFGSLEKVRSYWGAKLPKEEALNMVSMLHLEVGMGELAYGRVDSSRVHFQKAESVSGLHLSLTGALGYRTVHQVEPKAQLLLVSHTSDRNGSTCPTVDLNLPQNVCTPNEDSLLGQGRDIREASDVLIAPRFVDTNKSSTTRAKDDQNGCVASLNAIQQALILAHCFSIEKSSRQDDMQRWEMTPYIEAIDSQQRSSFIIQFCCDMLRVQFESTRSHTKERALLMMEKLVQRVSEPFPGVAERIYVCYGVQVPCIPALRREYGNLLVRSGLIGEAVKVYEDLELWDNAIYCYSLLEKRAVAVELIKVRLSERPNDPRLWCSLGDITNDNSCYEKALEVSENRSARAKRSLARSAYNKGEYETSKILWETAMALNSLYPDGWFALGAAALKAGDVDKSLDAFTRAVQLDPENGEAWNNIACLHMMKKKNKEAFIAFKEALKYKRNSWELWENYSHVAADVNNFGQAIEAVKKVLDMTNNKRIDYTILERVMQEIEVQALSSQIESSVTTNNHHISEKCDIGHEGQLTSSDTGLARAQGDRLLMELLGKVLQQIVKSGAGAETWGLFARWHKLKGDLTMCSEALLKQVRSYQGSDLWKDKDRFRKFAHASLELSEVYIELASRSGSRRELITAEMHLKNTIKQMVMRVNGGGGGVGRSNFTTPPQPPRRRRLGVERWRMDFMTPQAQAQSHTIGYSSFCPPPPLVSFGSPLKLLYSAASARFQHHILRNSSSSTASTTTTTTHDINSNNHPNNVNGEKIKRKRGTRSRSNIQNGGDPLGRKELGKSVVKWIREGMKAMAADFGEAELGGELEFDELRQRMGPGVTFVIQAQPYLNAIPMPVGHEAVCLKASTHYPTLFDHFQRELREHLLLLQQTNSLLLPDWRQSQSWKLLKELANSAQHRAIARKVSQPKVIHGVLGMDIDKVHAIQSRIDDFTQHMANLLRIERDAELEFTQQELNAVPTPPDHTTSDSHKPIDFLVSHGQAEQELCDTLCNLIAVSTSTGLGGMHLVLFKVEGNHRLPPTNLSPGDMVCVRTCDSRGAGATSCMQGFVNNLGKDGCSISVALESRHGDPAFSKLFRKSVRIDRIPGLADAVTYERNCEALMMLQKKGLHKKNPSIAVVATLFGDRDDVAWLAESNLADWDEGELAGQLGIETYDDSQRKAIALGSNQKRPILVVQGPPGTGKTGLLKELILLAVRKGEKVLITAPTNAAVDNMVEKLSYSGINIVRVGNPARISPAVASRSLVEIVNSKLSSFLAEFDRKKSDLRKDLRHCLKDDSLAAGIRQLLKQLGKTLKKREKEAVKEIMSKAQVVLTTNTGAADPLIRRMDTFDLVVIDEAGQAIEPSCWIPILQGKRCILAGDQCQLAPVVLSRKALEGGLGISLLERAAALHEGVLFTKLTTQYRMNDAIASWASKEMYDGLLKSSLTVSSHLLVDSPFVQPTWITQCPLLLLDTRMPYGSLSLGCEEHLDPAGTGSFYNEGEADVVMQHVFSLIYAGVRPTAIAVQSPYVAQVQLLRDRLDELPMANGVEVATIDSFQGREADAVIISMVRSNTLGAVGFLGDSRRMNVAITRARKHVALVCDSSTICHNTILARLLRHIRYHGRVKHAEPDSSGGYGLGMNPMLPSVS